MKFKIVNNIFEIKKLTYKNIDKNYINRINDRNIKYKKKTIKQQINYIQSIRKKGDEIFQLLYRNKLVATSGFQFMRNITYQGILIIDKNFLGKGYAKYFILSFLIFVSKKYKKKLFCAVINKENIKSIKSFQKVGYQLKKKNKNNGMFFFLNIKNCKVKIRKNINEY
jgi:RimJ/RimL family protein N-acetyltransferase